MRWALLPTLAGALGCGASAPNRPTVVDWPVSDSPLLTIGLGPASTHELSQVSGVRMQRGVVLVANSGTYEIRRFDSTGAYLDAAGRKGQGPGEFLGIISIFPAPGDSVYSLDAGNLRWSMHDTAGRFVRVLPGGARALLRPSWLHRRVLVESNGPVPSPTWALRILDSLPESLPGAAATRARFDDLGYLWLEDSVGTNAWMVYAGTGPPLGRVVLPAGFRLHQAARDFVIGVERDSLDQEIVRAYRLSRPQDLLVRPASYATAQTSEDTVARSRLLADVGGLIIAQEIFYANHASYAANADSLQAKISSTAELVLLAGDKQHWIGMIYDRASRETCGISIGFPAPAGWLDGTPFCGR